MASLLLAANKEGNMADENEKPISLVVYSKIIIQFLTTLKEWVCEL